MKGVDKDIAMSDLLYKSLHDELSEDERIMLNCWLKDEANHGFYEKLQQPEKLYEEILEMSELDTGLYYRRLQRKMNRKRQLRICLAVASIAVILIPMVWLAGPFLPGCQNEEETPYRIVQLIPADRTTLKTGEGDVYYLADSVKQIDAESARKEQNDRIAGIVKTEQEIEYNVLATSSHGNIEVTLADSTRVWLNAGSRLRYPSRFTGDKREVELVGEAYFEVTKNKRLPFIVSAGTVRIEVLGTQFNVNVHPGKSCVTTLVEGCVKVRNKVNDSVVIYPGQQVNTLAGDGMVVKSVDPRFYIAWKRNRFAFQNEVFYKIMEQLSVWYDCTFEFSHPRLADLHFTTIIPRYGDISEVLGVLQATGEFEFVESGHHICIRDRKHITK